MGTFFKALEQAERERALKEQASRRATGSGEGAPIAPALPPPPEPTVRPIVEAPSVFQRQKEREPLPKRASVREAASSSIPRVDAHLVSLLAPTSFGAEQYRSLELRVEHLRKASNMAIVAVTSPRAGDGKTLTTINLAGALAQAPETRVLIVDADLRQSSMARYLGLDGARGRGMVGAILDPAIHLKDVVEPCPPFNFSVLRAGQRPSAPYELLKSPRLGQLLEEARQQYDYVILDMPPLVPLPDYGVIARWVDGFLVVVTANETPRKLVDEALKVLDPATVIGLIFNGADRPFSQYYGGHVRERGKWWGRAHRAREEDGAE
jgi:capsular exopolysaccharide synthesis family protein